MVAAANQPSSPHPESPPLYANPMAKPSAYSQPAPIPRPSPQITSNNLFEWREGIPSPYGAQPMTKEQVQTLYFAAAALPYNGVWNPETQAWEIPDRFQGCTTMEVIIQKQFEEAASGNLKATEQVIDRILGKPKQAVDVAMATMSYSEFLEKLANEDAQANNAYAQASSQVIDIANGRPFVQPDASNFDEFDKDEILGDV